MGKQKIKKIIILGAGGNSRDIVDTINDINFLLGKTYECVGYLDDDKVLLGKEFLGIKVLGPIKSATKFTDCFFVNGIYSVVDFFINEEVIKKSEIPLIKFETIIHPSSEISRTARIGRGSVLLKNVSILSEVVLGKHVIIHPGAIISHDTKIGDYSFIANSASIGGYVTVGKSCFIGSNSALRDRINVGNYCIIGMGSIVLDNVPAGSTYVGNPAKFLRKSRK